VPATGVRIERTFWDLVEEGRGAPVPVFPE
jgi:hypothetical protein